ACVLRGSGRARLAARARGRPGTRILPRFQGSRPGGRPDPGKLQRREAAGAGRVMAQMLLADSAVFPREESMPSILIVEDETATAWALAESPKDDGHETATVESAEDALAHVRSRVPDLVITDLRLPGMSGLALTRRLRSGRHPMPVIVVTAFGSPE